MRLEQRWRTGESGSALVISILIVFVLSVLGMALMLTTTTETDISANYRWGEMAFFNAEAALEYGKNVLAAYALRDTNFDAVLPQARDPISSGSSCIMNMKPVDCPLGPAACSDPAVPGCRDYQYDLDLSGGQKLFIGRVLRDFNNPNRAIQYDFRQPTASDTRGDIDRDGTVDIEGAVTLWVRRPVVGDHDYGSDPNEIIPRVVLTAEGTAPNYEYIAGSGQNGSVRRLEITMSIAPQSGIAGSDYSHTGTGSDPTGTLNKAGWKTVDTIQ